MYSNNMASSSASQQGNRKLHVKNVGEMQDEDLRLAFAKYGKIESGKHRTRGRENAAYADSVWKRCMWCVCVCVCV